MTIRPATILTAGSTAVTLYRGDAAAVLTAIRSQFAVDFVFADPPYFLSGGGSTCKGGKRVSVDKGDWDVPISADAQHTFACRWLSALAPLMAWSGSVFVCGTSHGIRHVHRAAVDTLGWTLHSEIIWEKPNPPPNLACSTITHAHETILWLRPPGRRPKEIFFNYAAARALSGKQMRSVWRDIAAPRPEEKARAGRRTVDGEVVVGHPTQKSRAIVERCMLLALPEGGVALDPFSGGGTTAEAAVVRGAVQFVGVDLDRHWVSVTGRRAKRAPALREGRVLAGGQVVA